MKHIHIILLSVCLLAGTAGMSRAEVAFEEITVDNAWVKAMPPSAEYSAAFLTITNASEEDLALVEVRSDVAETVEIHEMETIEGVMSMRPTKNLAIPHGESVALEPGGTHIMLIDLVEPLTEGESVDLTLVFANGMERQVSAVIKKMVFDDEEDEEADAEGGDEEVDEEETDAAEQAGHEGHH